MATMNVLISNTLTRLSMASGIGTQTYAEDRIALAINEAFIDIFEERFWNIHTTQETFTLDGSTGVVTDDLTDKIKQFSDIQYIWLENYRQPLPLVPKNMPEAMVRKKSITATNTAKIFKVLPAETAGNVIVSYRTRPDEDYSGEDEVPMDRFLLMYRALYDILMDEGMNEMATQKFLTLYIERKNKLAKLEDQPERSLHDYSTANGPEEWQELP